MSAWGDPRRDEDDALFEPLNEVVCADEGHPEFEDTGRCQCGHRIYPGPGQEDLL